MGPPLHVMYRAHGPQVDAHGKIDREVVRRAWSLARPYRRRLVAFVGLTVLGSVAMLIPPLVFAQVIDHAIPQRDTRLLTWLFVIVVAVGVVTGV
ncbi:MAG: hypothetical protein LC789_10150, partial [Actinobacteria bacterium]|nr:hypothetical protein [Actinomycetota bacterium]